MPVTTISTGAAGPAAAGAARTSPETSASPVAINDLTYIETPSLSATPLRLEPARAWRNPAQSAPPAKLACYSRKAVSLSLVIGVNRYDRIERLSPSKLTLATMPEPIVSFLPSGPASCEVVRTSTV